MAARIIAILNQKGGVGKTTTVLNLGAALAARGERVLLVDADPQCSLSKVLIGPGAVARLAARETVAGLFGPKRIPHPQSLTRPTDFERLSFWAGSVQLDVSNTTVPHEAPRDDQRRLAVALRGVKDQFDTILIDCHPDLHLVAWAALVAATGLVVPIVAEELGIHGMTPMAEVVTLLRGKANPGLTLLGFLVCLYEGRLRIHREFDGELRRTHGEAVFAARVVSSVEVKLATMNGKPVVASRPKCRASEAFFAVAAELVARSDAADHALSTPIAGVVS